jgi:SAM-dependent methyltransferase
MRFYDETSNRLIWIRKKATADYWANEWDSAGINKSIYRPKSYISRLTAKHMQPHDKPILEAGCGRAIHVYALQKQGFNVIGVDFAEKTIEQVKTLMPDLDIRAGDVLNLPFDDNSFSGYWSIGLIEHFWDGYDKLVEEAFRIVAPGGFAFFTFPYMSPIRRFKALLGRYPKLSAYDTLEPEDFYQFSLTKSSVQQNVEKAGFKFVTSKGLDGLKGFKSEVQAISAPLQKLYDYKGNSTIVRGGRYALSESLTLFSAHSILLVFEKPK